MGGLPHLMPFSDPPCSGMEVIIGISNFKKNVNLWHKLTLI